MRLLNWTPGTDRPADERSQKRALAIQFSWFIFFALVAGTFVLALPLRWEALTTPGARTAANLVALGLPVAVYAVYLLALEIVFSGIYLLLGGLIVLRRTDDRMSLLAATFLVAFGVANQSVVPTIDALRGRQPALDVWLNALTFIAWVGFAWFFYLFPTGRFVPAWTRWLAGLWVLIAIAWNFAPGSLLDPLRWPRWLFLAVIGGYWITWLGSQVYRYRRASNAVERQQTRWVLYGMAVCISVGLALFVTGAFVPGYAFLVEAQPTPVGQAYLLFFWTISRPLLLLLPATLAVSILRYRLWAIDLVVNRTLVYGILTAGVVAGYGLIVGGTGAIFQTRGSGILALLATGVIAAAFHPLRERVQRGVNRMMYGERDDPYAALSRFSQRLETVLAPGAVLPTIVETVAHTLKLPYVALAVSADEADNLAAVHGTDPGGLLLRLPLQYQEQWVGELRVAPRGPREPFTPAERRLLADLSAQAGAAVHAVRLTADLKRSREQLVAAREEERRRLRRDLHDGLGPKLAGQMLRLEAARDALDGQPQTARDLLDELLAESQTLLAEVRRLVYGLRPPALDELGLLTAVREQAAQVSLGGLLVVVDAPDTLPPLPAAVEVAAFRLVQEALTNVVRHARARTCRLTLTVDHEMRLEIIDDGVGLAPGFRPGVGLTSMRERAEEIGGACQVDALSRGGTRVTARLPITPI